MSVWVTSDCHFGHKNVIKYENRKYTNVEEMDLDLINRWNSKVGIKDEIYILGDFTLSNNKSYAIDILKRLNGRKYLILGNHDNISQKKEVMVYFEWVKKYFELDYKDNHFVMFHFPILSWNRKYHGAIHLYGHIHGNKLTEYQIVNEIVMKNSYNVSVEVNNYEPISLDEIIAKLNSATENEV